MKTYTDFPSQRSGNQWVGFRLLTAVPEVPVGHNSGENRTSYHHHGGCVPGLFQTPGVNRKGLSSRWQSSLSCLMGNALNWYHVFWKTPLFFPLSCTTHGPLRELWPFHLEWPDPDSCAEVAESNGHNHESEEKSINQTWRCLGTSASGPLLLSWQS